MIRFAKESDAPALLAIYSQYIDTAVTFEYELPTQAEFRERIADISACYPYLVFEENGRALGYAYAHRYQSRAAYQWNAELSIYLDRAACGRGVGRRLYAALIDLLKLQGVRTVYGIVTVPNVSSDRLHAAMGFTCLGIYHNTGYKCGAWHDVNLYEKAIASYDDAPAPVLAIGALPQEKVDAILR